MMGRRKVAGYAVALVSALGLVLCLGIILGALAVKNRVDAIGHSVFQAADNGLVFLETKIDLVGPALERSHDATGRLAHHAARLQNAGADIRQESTNLLQTLEVLSRELKSAGSWMDSCLAIANSISSVSAAVASSEHSASQPEAAAGRLAREVREFSDSVITALNKVQTVRSELVRLLDSGVVTREIALGFIDRITQLERVVAALNERVEKLKGKTAEARTACRTFEQKTQRWTLAATVAASTIPLWFGISQLVMIKLGWHLRKPQQDDHNLNL